MNEHPKCRRHGIAHCIACRRSARGIGVRSTTTEGRGPEGAEPGPQDAPKGSMGETPAAAPAPAEPPDEGELEAWRSTADDLLRGNPSRPLLRRAAFLLQNAYLFASKLAAPPPQAAAPAGRQELAEEVKRLAHAYADAKLARYGFGVTEGSLSDPSAAYCELVSAIDRLAAQQEGSTS
jgi:hypothetical protein